MSNRSSSGFSLVEVLIAAGIALLLLGVIVSLLVSSTRISIKGANQVELQQRALIVGDRFARDLRSSVGGGLGVLSSGEDRLVTIHPRLAEVGGVNWQDRVLVYAWSLPNLKTFAYQVSAVSGPYLPSFAELQGLSEGQKTTTLDIEGVTNFDCAIETGPLVKFSLTLEKGDQKTQVERAVLLRQGF